MSSSMTTVQLICKGQNLTESNKKKLHSSNCTDKTRARAGRPAGRKNGRKGPGRIDPKWYCLDQFSSVYVQFMFHAVYITAALSCVSTFQCSADQVSLMSSLFPATDCSRLTNQRLRSFVDRSQQFWSAA